MDFKIKFKFSNDDWLLATLTVSRAPGTVYFDVNFQHDLPQLKYNLSNFNEVFISDRNSTQLTFKGYTTISFKFLSSVYLTSLWALIQKYFNFTTLPGTSPHFIITPKQPQKNDTLFHKRPFPQRFPSLLNELKRNLEEFEFHESNSPSFSQQTKEIMLDNQLNIKFNEVSNIVILMGTFEKLLKSSFFNEDLCSITEKYKQIRNQWKLLTDDQLLYSPDICKMINDIEEAVKYSDIRSSDMKYLFFDILISFHFFIFSNTFNKEIFSLIKFTLLSLYLGGANEKFYSKNGNINNFFESAASVFWISHSIHQSFMDIKNDLIANENELRQFFITISKSIPKLIKLNDLLGEDSYVEIDRVFKDLIVSSCQNFQTILGAILISKHPKLLSACIESAIAASFIKAADGRVHSIEIGREVLKTSTLGMNISLLLFNAEKLMQHLIAATV